MDSLDHVPAWLLRPLPVNTVIDETLNARIDQLGAKLPTSLKELQQVLDAVRAFREYDSAVNRGTVSGPLARHAQGRRVLEKYDLPVLPDLGKLRELLDIRSERQLGFFLLASDKDNGPYTTFTIPKRDGSERPICAPKGQLRWV